MHDDELSHEERDRLRALPRELHPDDGLEERTVRALRADGLLRGARRVLALPLTPGWVGMAAAASFAIFAGGFAIGGWLEARHTTQVVTQLHEQDATRAAALVQQTGSAYVSALAALASVSDSSRAANPQLAQGREVAVNALHAAANQLVRIAPEDPLAVQILASMQRAGRDSTSSPDRLVWF